MTVVWLYRDDVVSFLKREGSVITGSIAQRFGWDHHETLIRLQELERQGLVRKERATFEWGAGWAWSAVQTGA